MKIQYIIRTINERIIELSKNIDSKKLNVNIGATRINELETLRGIIQKEFKEDIRLESSHNRRSTRSK